MTGSDSADDSADNLKLVQIYIPTDAEHWQPASSWEQGGGSAIPPTWPACTVQQWSTSS